MKSETKSFLLLKYGSEENLYKAYCNKQSEDIGTEEYDMLGEYFDEYLRLNPLIRIQKITL